MKQNKEKEPIKLSEDEKWEWINVAQEKMKTLTTFEAVEIADKFIKELRKRIE